ncbi:MAG: hypothetical protein ABFS45_13790 [Pseudomonadota bacterium]
MSIILAFYAIAILAIIGAAYGVFRVFAVRSRVLGAGLAALTLSTLVLLWPIPGHGTFTFLGEMLYRELDRALDRRAREAKQRAKQAFVEQVEARFYGPLNFSVTKRLSDHWYQVLVDGALPAWYETDSRMLWSEWLAFEADASLPSLKAAKARCQGHPPQGHWALISEMENYLLWKAGGHKLLPRAPASTISYLVDENMSMEMPTYSLSRPAANSNRQPTEYRDYVVRCVARGPNAPPGGYVRRDVSLEEWNRYQLSKASN